VAEGRAEPAPELDPDALPAELPGAHQLNDSQVLDLVILEFQRVRQHLRRQRTDLQELRELVARLNARLTALEDVVVEQVEQLNARLAALEQAG